MVTHQLKYTECGVSSMVYLEYEINTKQVVEIHETEPTLVEGYDYAMSDEFVVGDELEKTIWINVVTEDKYVTSASAIRNNPQAKRLLEENKKLKQDNALLQASVLEMTTYAALQDERLVTQEQALLELSTLVAGGNV